MSRTMGCRPHFTNNIGRIFQAFEQLEVGGVLVNEIPTFRADHMPLRRRQGFRNRP